MAESNKTRLLIHRALPFCIRLCEIALILFVGYMPLLHFWDTQAVTTDMHHLETNLIMHAIVSPLYILVGIGLLQLRRWSIVLCMVVYITMAVAYALAFLGNALFIEMWISPETGEWVRWHPMASLNFAKTLPLALLFYFAYRQLPKANKQAVNLATS